MKIFIRVLKHGIEGMRILVRDGFVKAQNYINSFNIDDIERDSTG
jgi:hypothetical protein